jgi:hypothetical protein
MSDAFFVLECARQTWQLFSPIYYCWYSHVAKIADFIAIFASFSTRIKINLKQQEFDQNGR